MIKDYSSFGPAYRNFKVREGVYVPEPVAEFSGDNPFTRMAPIRGELKDIAFDDTYTYLDKSLKFKILRNLTYLVACLVAFPLNRIRFGLRIEGREKIRRNRKLLAGGVMTVCNHVHRWDMICVMQAMRFRKPWIPMYAQPFRGKDGFIMKAVGGIAIPEERSGFRGFDKALDELHERRQWIHIFPESCSWKFYAPLRPFKMGTFNMAYRYFLPVVPLMITFRPRTGWRKLFGKGEPLVTIHVGDPIVPDTRAPRKDETARLRDQAHKTMLDMAGIVSNPWPSGLE